MTKEQNYSITIVLLQSSPALDSLPSLAELPELPSDDLLSSAVLQAARNSSGLSQSALAKILGISPKTVNDAENGLSNTHERILRAMRREFERLGVRFLKLPDGVGVVLSRSREDIAASSRSPVVQEAATPKAHAATEAVIAASRTRPAKRST